MQEANNTVTCSIGSSKWDVQTFLGVQPVNCPYAVLILNRPIPQSISFIPQFWNSATLRITVDGGTSHFDNLINRWNKNDTELLKIPELITGDFDSVNEDILKKYKEKGSKIIHTPDQNYTDFTKALMELNKYCLDNHKTLKHVVAICQASGRIDQTLGNIQTLFLAKEKNLLGGNVPVVLMTDDALSWLLFPGDHCIMIPESVRQQRKAWCSLVPIGEKCESVTTSGLKWNLDKQPLKFGELVSTSNTFGDEDEVNVNCSHTLLWSMKLPQLFGN